jgi:hypothetical protein
MAIQLSPGVNVTEIDQTGVVPSVFTTAGAFVGTFNWGPAQQINLVDNAATLKRTFGAPDSNAAISFFTASNFLSYGNNLSIVRAMGVGATNATANGSVQIANEDVFQSVYLNTTSNNLYGPFAAKYSGVLGNTLKVSVCSSTAEFSTWAYKGLFSSAPGTSEYAASKLGSNDEMHIVVIDSIGKFASANSVLEVFPFVSKASDAIKANDGTTNYYKQVLFNSSSYVYAIDPVDYANTNSTWGDPASNTNFAQASNYTVTLAGGQDDVPSTANLQSSWDLFANKEDIDVSLLITGDAGGDASANTIQNYVIGIAETRRDCVAFISPRSTDVVNKTNSSTVATNIQNWINSIGITSSYAVADSGWKYQFDQYGNTYRWIPLNGDIAGLCAFTDAVRDPWFSPAGFNRGLIKNAIKLAWSPSQTYRDSLYSIGVNPVVSFQGQGNILFGDKTLQSKPSAFDRINVRRLFITLEKSIASAARFSLFEFNNESTRSQFVALVEPYLRQVQGRGGIEDFRVVCDTTNNTPQVIDSNQFVGDIYIKPARSINFIQLNFVAVGSGANFTTIVGG